MYKDKAKQKEANRLAKQRERAKKAGMAKKAEIERINSSQDGAESTNPVIPDTVILQNQVIPNVIPSTVIPKQQSYNPMMGGSVMYRRRKLSSYD